MATPAVPKVQIRLGTGSGFGDVLVLGDLTDGILGTNILGTQTATVVDVSPTVQRISIRRGRDRIFEHYTPGVATITFLDFTGDWNPDNLSSPYYGKILPMRQVKITTDYAGVGYSLYTGFIKSWDWEWADQAADYAIVTIQCVDAFRLLQLANITTVAGAANKDLPGTRIGQLLDAAGWPTTLRSIAPGDTELQTDPGSQRAALAAIQTVEESDLGGFFIDADGIATYYDRETYATKSIQTAVDFDDDGTDVAYQNLDVNLDDTEIYNQVTITREGGTPQTVSDATSISNYFLRSYSSSGLLMETNTLALAKANAILQYRKDARIRIDSITLDLSSVSSRLVPGLSLDFGDPIYVRRRMADNTVLDLRITVNGVNHDITPDRWTATFNTAYPLSPSPFILGSAQFGILGTSTL